jgi:hypothetical protein
MSQKVKSIDLGVEWDPNAPEAELIIQDSGVARLTMGAHPNDPDQRRVVLSWEGVALALMTEPNDEAIAGHPLYPLGLAQLRSAGVVTDSATVSDLKARNQVHPHHVGSRYTDLIHFVLPLKECVVEVVARTITVARGDAPHHA